MIAIKYYQDLEGLGQDETKRMAFVLSAVQEHKRSAAYLDAVDAEAYYNGENPTITRYEKIIYDMQGLAHRDMYTANHKIASAFFGLAVNQQAAYLLGNGVSFAGEYADKLGADFDQRMMEAAILAIIGGVAFVMYDKNRVHVFGLNEFVPLYDDETSALRAGIYFWQNDSSRPFRATLYEVDGVTEYIQRPGEALEQMRKKRPYIEVVRSSVSDGVEIVDGKNYPGFPIVPLKNNRKGKNGLRGKRNTIDALDVACSNMVNNVSEGNLIYWVLSNCGGMDDLDDAKFVDRIRTLHVAHTDEDGAGIEPHTIEAPFQGTDATIDMLKKKLYEDFQCFDSAAVSAGNQTATAIAASYAPLDLKCDLFETQVTDCILGILALAGIADRPSYTRSKVINRGEETQTVLMGAQYYDEEYITKKLLTINGDADQYEAMMQRRAAEELSMTDGTDVPPPETLQQEPTP